MVSTPTIAATMRPVLLAVFVLCDFVGAGAGGDLGPDSEGDAGGGAEILATGGSAGSSTSAFWRRGTRGAASGGFAVIRLLNMSPGLMGSIVYGRSAFGLEHGDPAAAKDSKLPFVS